MCAPPRDPSLRGPQLRDLHTLYAKLDARWQPLANAKALGLVYKPLQLPHSTNESTPNPEYVQLALQSVFDPEIPVNVVDLGLIYETVIDSDIVKVTMTLTSPGCGMGPVLVEEIKDRVGEVPGVKSTEVEIVLDPPWSREKMTDAAKLELGIF